MIICARCGKEIVSDYVRAFDRPWHEGCFRCTVCGKGFKGQQFVKHRGRPYHRQCYQERFGPRCAGCGKKTAGDFVRALYRTWHEDCFRCTVCGKGFKGQQFVKHRGRPYHQQCYQERFGPRCAGCGQPITGKYITALKKTWHPEHLVCAHCEKPLDGKPFFEQDGKAYCEEDFHALFGRHCAVCGVSMQGTCLTNVWGDSFCEHHEGQIPECFSCGRFASERLTGGHVRYKDGRVMCKLCRQTAVDEELEGRQLLTGVRRALALERLDLGKIEIPLRLVDQGELDRLVGGARSLPPTGMVRTRLTSSGDGTVTREVLDILALHGLPREHLAAVLAHEVGHAWLFLNAFPELPPKVVEGICELCSFLWLKREGGKEAAGRLKLLQKNKDRVYGVGFRAARRAWRNRSLRQMLAYVKRYGRFPK